MACRALDFARGHAFVLGCVMFAGCSASSNASSAKGPSAAVGTPSSPERSAASGGSFGNTNGTSSTGVGAASSAPGTGTGAPPTGSPGSSSAAKAASSGAAASGDGADAGIDPRVQEALTAGQLTAGEWNDLDHWDFWRALHGECAQTKTCANAIGTQHSGYWGYNTAGRIPVIVKAGDVPVIDAKLTLYDVDQKVVWEAHTDHAGRAELFASMFAETRGPYQVEAQAGADSVRAQDVQASGGQELMLSLPSAHTPAPALDLMFVIDTTGSMGDELGYIQAELGNVIAQVRDRIGAQLSVRVSINFYRDRGDAYVVRPFAFTSDVSKTLADLAAQSSGGGGDLPEAVEEALDDAINQHAWRDAATARLLFLVLDAPPHYDTERLDILHRVTQKAAAQGVQIVPVAASGADKSTEFLLRNLALATHGTYAFLTDDSGIGNAHLAPTIGAYTVELLNELLVRVISARL